MKMKHILILNGPNLNLLGEREVDLYGDLNLQELEDDLTESYGHLNLEFFQSNHEGELIDKLHQARNSTDGVIFNPAAYTHTSVALRDAILAVKIPVVEVHLSNPDQREDFRKTNYVRDVCATHFQGKGIDSYKEAINYLKNQDSK